MEQRAVLPVRCAHSGNTVPRSSTLDGGREALRSPKVDDLLGRLQRAPVGPISVAPLPSASSLVVAAILDIADLSLQELPRFSNPAMYTAKYDGAVRTAKALQEIAMPMNLEATVEHRFQSFNTATKGTLGSFVVGVAPLHPA